LWEGQNGHAAVGPLKRPERIFEKTFEKHSNGFSKVCDIARASIVFKEIPDLVKCLEQIVSDSDVHVSRVKARLAPSHDATNGGGYRDVLINLRILKDTIYTNHVLEVQLHLERFYKLKKDELGGHKTYRIARTLQFFDSSITKPTFTKCCEKQLRGVSRGVVQTIDMSCLVIDTQGAEQIRDALTKSGEAKCCALLEMSFARAMKFGDKELELVADGIRRCAHCLRTLSLGCCKNISDHGLIAIANECPHLWTVLLGMCSGLTDRGIIEMSRLCTSLQIVNLYNCSNITDKSVDAISLNCLGLRELNICNSAAPFTDLSIRNLAHHSLRLEKLAIAGNYHINVKIMITLCMKCTRLMKLDISGCVKLVWSKEMWEAFKTFLSPNLEVHCDVRDHGLSWYKKSLPFLSEVRSLEL